MKPNKEDLISLIKKGTLSVLEKIKLIELSEDDLDVTTAVVNSIEWQTLSNKEMLEIIKFSDGNWHVINAVIETKKLSLNDVLELIFLYVPCDCPCPKNT
jgi:hypothetical protein